MSDGEAAIEPTSAWATFATDLRFSAAAWQRDLTVPLLTLVLVLGSAFTEALGREPGQGAFWFLSLPFDLAYCGWVGTQRIWYLRMFRGQTLAPGELFPLTRSFFMRFFVLNVLVSIASLPAFWVALAITGGFPVTHHRAAFVIMVSTWAFVLDVALTFVTPVLAFSTTSAVEALQEGVRLLARQWRHAIWYALVPPLALVLVARSLPREVSGFWIPVALGVTGGMLGLWFKGATAAYYLRRVPDVGPVGSALGVPSRRVRQRFPTWNERLG